MLPNNPFKNVDSLQYSYAGLREGKMLPRDHGMKDRYVVGPNGLPKKGSYIDFYATDGEKKYGKVTALDDTSIFVKVAKEPVHKMTLIREDGDHAPLLEAMRTMPSEHGKKGHYPIDHLGPPKKGAMIEFYATDGDKKYGKVLSIDKKSISIKVVGDPIYKMDLVKD